MPVFLAKKEVFAWIKDGRKTVDIRKGKPRSGTTALFLSGPNRIELPILETKTGELTEVVNLENYKQVIPPAESLQAALDYLSSLYGEYEGLFTAYYLANGQK